MDHVTYQETLERIAAAAGRSGRSPEEVRLVAVGKTFPPEKIMELYRAGHRDFGENRAQELSDKVSRMPADVRWHFIGPLQRNKVRLVRPAVVLLHSMDRLSLAEAWLKGPGAPPPVLVEVNIGEEPQKAGVSPEETPRFVDELFELGVEVRGLMAIPPRVERPEQVRPHFRRMATLLANLRVEHPGLEELSMGMTEDFEVAVEEGATLVRLGRAIFGPRSR